MPRKRRTSGMRASDWRRPTRSRGRGDAERGAAGEALEVLHAAQILANFLAQHGVRFQLGDGVQARFDFVAIDFRTQHPGAQQARAHAGDRGVNGRQQRSRASTVRAARSFVGKQRRDQFQVADGDRVQNQRVLLLVEAQRIEVQPARRSGRRSWRRFRAGSATGRLQRRRPACGRRGPVPRGLSRRTARRACARRSRCRKSILPGGSRCLRGSRRCEASGFEAGGKRARPDAAAGFRAGEAVAVRRAVYLPRTARRIRWHGIRRWKRPR